MSTLYERADIYDLLENEEKYQWVKRHWATLLEGRGIRSLLDVSIGSGGTTLPLAELGVRLYGSDLSGSMLERCGEKAKAKGLSADLRQSDFRELTAHFDRQFDCVASTGNSIAYVTNGEAERVLEQMDALVKPGGYLYYDIRNWDKILRDRSRFYLYDPVFHGETRVNLIQVWDYLADGTMNFNLLFTLEQNQKIVQKESFVEHYYPLPRAVLLDKLKRLGYEDVQIWCYPAFVETVDPAEANWYCVMAGKPAG